LINRLETNIGEIGSNISGGQKQRLVIARAIYSNPKILILDEATNALDMKTETKILKNLKLYRPNLTVLIVSHRLDTLSTCDRIYQIKNKKIHLIN
jgi:ABC-type bacteriocin/lantibiotic exporter with double-glycine peptidase domain